MDQARWVELETKVAFQERALAQLDEVVRDLYAEVQRLQGELQTLRTRLSEPPPAAPEQGFAEGLLPDDD